MYLVDWLYIWLRVMLGVIIAAPLVRKRRSKTPLDEKDLVVAGFALGSAISLVKVLFKVIIEKKLQTDLD